MLIKVAAAHWPFQRSACRSTLVAMADSFVHADGPRSGGMHLEFDAIDRRFVDPVELVVDDQVDLTAGDDLGLDVKSPRPEPWG
jgi:hypothetical protein